MQYILDVSGWSGPSSCLALCALGKLRRALRRLLQLQTPFCLASCPFSNSHNGRLSLLGKEVYSRALCIHVGSLDASSPEMCSLVGFI